MNKEKNKLYIYIMTENCTLKIGGGIHGFDNDFYNVINNLDGYNVNLNHL